MYEENRKAVTQMHHRCAWRGDDTANEVCEVTYKYGKPVHKDS